MELTLDLEILFMTVWRVLRSSVISRDGRGTMPEFMGTESAGREEL